MNKLCTTDWHYSQSRRRNKIIFAMICKDIVNLEFRTNVPCELLNFMITCMYACVGIAHDLAWGFNITLSNCLRGRSWLKKKRLKIRRRNQITNQPNQWRNINLSYHTLQSWRRIVWMSSLVNFLNSLSNSILTYLFLRLFHRCPITLNF